MERIALSDCRSGYGGACVDLSIPRPTHVRSGLCTNPVATASTDSQSVDAGGLYILYLRMQNCTTHTIAPVYVGEALSWWAQSLFAITSDRDERKACMCHL